MLKTFTLHVALLATVAASAPAFAQGDLIPPTVRLRVSQRWLDAGQPARLVPFVRTTYWLFVETAERNPINPSSRAVHRVLFDSPHSPAAVATIEGRADGRSQKIAVKRVSEPRNHRDSVRRRNGLLFDCRESRLLSIPESRLWELIPPFHPARLQRGERWTDTLGFHTEEFGFRQTLRSVRVSTLLADTIIGGRQFWLVGDSANVLYEELSIEREQSLDSVVFIRRTGTGIAKGRMLYDPALGLFREREDTAALEGTALLRYPDGSVYETPTRFERQRRWAVFDSGTLHAWDLAVLAERQRPSVRGLTNTSPNEIDERLAAGDSSIKDSLLASVLRSSDPNEIKALLSLVRVAKLDTAIERKLHEFRVSNGDSAYLVQRMVTRLSTAGTRPGSAIDELTMRQAIALMNDPGALFGIGANRDVLYMAIAGVLMYHPPAVTADSALWPCSPAACALLARQWRVAREERVRQLGLLARFALDPVE